MLGQQNASGNSLEGSRSAVALRVMGFWGFSQGLYHAEAHSLLPLCYLCPPKVVLQTFASVFHIKTKVLCVPGWCLHSFLFSWEIGEETPPYRRGHLHFHCHVSPCIWLCNKSLWLVGKPQTQRFKFNQTQALLRLLPAVAILCFLRVLPTQRWGPCASDQKSLVTWSGDVVPDHCWNGRWLYWANRVITPAETISSGCKMEENFASCFNYDNIFHDRWWLMNGTYPNWQSIYLAFIFLGTGGILWKEYYLMGHLFLISIVSSK